MLKKFEVQGFKNFNEKITLDFSDVRSEFEFNEHCVKDGLVKSAMIYGRNGTGKSNLMLAIIDIVQHFTDSLMNANYYENYTNVASRDGMAEFRYVFQFGKDIVDYSYGKTSYTKLAYERLYINDELLMKKHYDTSSGDDLSRIQTLAPTLNYASFASGSILKYIINNTIIADWHPLAQMMSFVLGMHYLISFDEKDFGPVQSERVHAILSESPELIDVFQKMLNDNGNTDKLHMEIDFDGIARLYTAPGYCPTARLPFFKTASRGTVSLFTFSLAVYVLTMNTKSTLLLYDEFDAFYHFELAEYVVKTLATLPNIQTILTTHNTNLMTNILMRPDCYFILTPERIASLPNATTRELSGAHNLQKLFKGGEFNGL